MGAQSSSEMNEWFVIFKVLAEKYRREHVNDTPRRPSCPSSINYEVRNSFSTARHSLVATEMLEMHRLSQPSTPVLSRTMTPEEFLQQTCPHIGNFQNLASKVAECRPFVPSVLLPVCQERRRSKSKGKPSSSPASNRHQ